MLTADFDYHLPPELIASEPLADRSASRMMVIHRSTGQIEHRSFREIAQFLLPGDLLVLNNTRVVPARFFTDTLLPQGTALVAPMKASGRTVFALSEEQF